MYFVSFLYNCILLFPAQEVNANEEKSQAQVEAQDEAQVEVKSSFLSTWFDFVCGIPKQHDGKEEENKEEEERRARMAVLEEKPIWTYVLNWNAILAMCALCFLMGYYA